eukprot:3485136-Rhodomonas_salina.1
MSTKTLDTTSKAYSPTTVAPETTSFSHTLAATTNIFLDSPSSTSPERMATSFSLSTMQPVGPTSASEQTTSSRITHPSTTATSTATSEKDAESPAESSSATAVTTSVNVSAADVVERIETTTPFEATTRETSVDAKMTADTTPYASVLVTSTPTPGPSQQLFQIVVSSLLVGISEAEFEVGLPDFRKVVASLFADRSVDDVIVDKYTEQQVWRPEQSTARRRLVTAVEVTYRVVGFSSAIQADKASVIAASGTQLRTGLMTTGQPAFDNLQSIEVSSVTSDAVTVPDPADTSSAAEVDTPGSEEKGSTDASPT